MAGEIWERSARIVAWLIRRNPMYLLSAALIAIGARLYLVDSSNVAGDIRLILWTLVILQVYEWAVGGMLVLLHHARRSPEDRPSLLLVALLFWTGPMAATMEMTALRHGLGTILSASVCLIALAEFRFVRRRLGIQITFPGRIAACVCVTLVAAVPPVLRLPELETGLHELYLYAAWWVLGAIALVAIDSLHAARRIKAGRDGTGTVMHPPQTELLFLAITIGIVALQLVAMNHAFFCHASWFYLAPLLIALGLVGMESMAIHDSSNTWSLIPFAMWPGVAILLSFGSFDPAVPIELLPAWLRDPVITTALAATTAWWFAFWRHRVTILFHAGVASLALTMVRVMKITGQEAPATDLPVAEGVSLRNLLTLAAFGVAAYFAASAIVRRCRAEGVAAVAAFHAGVVLLVWGRVEPDVPLMWLATGWNLMIGLHVAIRRPHPVLQLLPIAVLAVGTCFYEFDPTLQWYARAHAGLQVTLLYVIGLAWGWPVYRRGAGVLMWGYGVLFITRSAIAGPNPVAALVVTAGFALFLAGAWISWFKRSLLGSRQPHLVDRADPQNGV